MKTNSDLSADESATASTTKPESDNVNMSAGAEMLIERMKTNPEDFKYGGRFYRVTQTVLNGHHAGWVSRRDYEALTSAYEGLFTEVEFSEWVYGEIFNPKEEPAPSPWGHTFTPAMAVSSSGNLGIGTSPTSALTVNANAGNPMMTLGNTTLSESMLQQVKTKLGL